MWHERSIRCGAPPRRPRLAPHQESAMRRRQLDMQSDRIEAVLASHKVASRVWGATITPRFIRFQVTTAMGTKVNKVSDLSEEIALSLGVRSARVYRQQGAIHVEVPREQPEPVRLLPLCQRIGEAPPITAVLGLDEEGTPLLLRLPSPDIVHVLVAGTTGSGKTALARSLLLSLALYNSPDALRLVLIDPKGRGLGPLGSLPHVIGRTAASAEEGAKALAWLVKEMERRDSTGASSPVIVTAVDELADLLLTGGKAVETALVRLAQRGREAGIHLVTCTQKPSAELVSGLLKANFPVRLVGAVSSPEDAKVASGLAGIGAEKLLGRGDFLLVAKGNVIRFQAAYATEEEMAQTALGIRMRNDNGSSGEIEAPHCVERQTVRENRR
ncbi:MAG TPA: DNA translocase FtsK [Anaerolineae bacterium]|nr:DNA translocase FtsK [Anaerolineae bacterium]